MQTTKPNTITALLLFFIFQSCSNLNIDKIKNEIKTDKLNATATLYNHQPNQQIFLNESKNGTKIMDKNGNLLIDTPLTNLSFVSTSQGVQCFNYLKQTQSERLSSTKKFTFFYIDIKNKKLTELNSAIYIKAINENLVAIFHKRKESSIVDNNNTYLYNTDFKRVNNKAYSDIVDMGDVFIAVKNLYTYGLMDINGNEIGDQKYKNISAFKNGIAAVEKEEFTNSNIVLSKVGFINTKGEYIVPLVYDNKILACSKQDKHYAQDGYIVPPEQFDYPQIVCKDGLLGWVDFEQNAKLVIPVIYFELTPIDHTKKLLFLARKKESDSYGVINRKGEVIIPFQYNDEEINDILSKRGLLGVDQ